MQDKVKFHSDWMQMLDAYYKLERQFFQITDIIPVDNNPETHSPVLYSVLQTACGQIENMLRLLCDYFELKYKSHHFPNLYYELNTTGILERQIVYYSKTTDAYRPFLTNNPIWWKGYNETKHDLPNGFRKGNIQNVVYAMSGLFCLHCMSHYAYYSIKNFFCPDHWMEETSISTGYGNNPWRNPSDERPHSEIFYCLSKYTESGVFT